MTKRELVEQLNNLGVKPSQYSLDGGVWIDGIILEKTTNSYDYNKEYVVWNVFYYERSRVDEASFSTESEALINILERFKRLKH
jgi:hypothetical protein